MAENGQARVRPLWSGTLSFGLVSIPVNLFPAVRRGRVAMRMLDEDGTPLSRRWECPAEGVEVHPEHLLRGYELESGEYVVVRDDELEALAPRKSRDIDLRRFVPRDEVDPIYFDRPYVLAPAGDSAKAYRLLAEAMAERDCAAIATFVMRGHEYFVAIIAEGGILRAQTMRFDDELRGPDDIGLPEAKKPGKALVDRMRSVLRKHAAKQVRAQDLEDRLNERLLALIERKRASGKDVIDNPAAPDEEDGREEQAGTDLLAALRGSLAAAAGDGRSSARRSKQTKHTTGRDGDLEQHTKQQLYDRAAELGIPGRSRMTKAELIRSIRAR